MIIKNAATTQFRTSIPNFLYIKIQHRSPRFENFLFDFKILIISGFAEMAIRGCCVSDDFTEEAFRVGGV